VTDVRSRGYRVLTRGAGLVHPLYQARGAVRALLVGLLVCSVLPVLFGWRVTVVVSGSMTPAVRVGDVVAAAPVAAGDVPKLAVGTVILVADPGHPGRLLLHRLVAFNPDGTLVTKGDANAVRDGLPVPPAAVRGVAKVRVPMIGLPKVWASDGNLLPLLALGILGMALLAPRRAPARRRT
jgi:signal peptidase I